MEHGDVPVLAVELKCRPGHQFDITAKGCFDLSATGTGTAIGSPVCPDCAKVPRNEDHSIKTSTYTFNCCYCGKQDRTANRHSSHVSRCPKRPRDETWCGAQFQVSTLHKDIPVGWTCLAPITHVNVHNTLAIEDLPVAAPIKMNACNLLSIPNYLLS
jgi:hypothetical protein